MTLDEAEVDKRVTYCDGFKTEHGVITSKNHMYIFVNFDGSQHTHGIACNPSYIKYEVEGEAESFVEYEENNATDLEEALNIALNGH